MHFRRTGLRLAAAAVTFATASALEAQAWNYPSFQAPRVTTRELNFAIADGGEPGTGFIFQWREGMAQRSQLSADLGYAEPDCGPFADCDGFLLLGGQFGRQLVTATADMPIDLMLTAGLNAAIGDLFNLIRVPVGVSIGHRFKLENAMAITPYGHLRMSYDRISMDGGGSDSDMSPNFDLGASFEFNRTLAVRVSAMFGGADYLGNEDALGISLAWSPRSARTTSPAPAPRPRR